jgi:protein tyrosine/serine phosphatase
MATSTLPPVSQRAGRRRLVLWILLGLALIPAWRLYYILLAGNFHAVADGQCYRGAQPSAADLATLVRRHHIRTVINLRGVADEDEPWYPLEVKTAGELGIKLVDVGMWSNSPPEVDEFRKLIRSLSEDDRPFFLHCFSGSDRTGLASALYLLLRTSATLPEARGQLGLYYGHIPRGRADCQDRVLDCYENWLLREGQVHSPMLLRRWGLEVYDGRLD